ncbi:metallophosphoesterase [Acidisoma cellulosilytica]|uniref:Metallophosphoesterase n=2 Tax=Acidisoma cellulosilyticum TaxID=2802395 RepID=A0A963YZR9_9PROT|nr:metallophosphoesterase [Acidisoma cellulosilyticum]
MVEAPLSIPESRPLRVVGDVHGDVSAFAYATDTDRFLIQLGDLVDYGPDSAGVLRRMFDLIDQGRGLFLLGNHDLKLARFLLGQKVRSNAELIATRKQMDDALRERFLAEVARAPLWLQDGPRLFIHAGFHTDMLLGPSPQMEIGRAVGVNARALFGEPTGMTQMDGFPERSLRWVHRIPPGVTVYVGHDRRSQDGRPLEQWSRAGGRAIFLDTGAGKGGHLSWIDLPPLESDMRVPASFR